MGAMNGTSPLKFVLLSGHDTTFIPFLAAVVSNAWDQEWPRYASLATIELLRVAAGSGTGKGTGSSAQEGGSDDDDNDDLDAGGDGDGGDVGGEYFFRFVYNGEVLKLEGCDQGESVPRPSNVVRGEEGKGLAQAPEAPLTCVSEGAQK